MSIFASFTQIWAKIEFSPKIRLRHFLSSIDAYHHVKFQKKVMNGFREKSENVDFGSIFASFTQIWAKIEFCQNFSFSSIYRCLPPYQISQKSDERILRKAEDGHTSFHWTPAAARRSKMTYI